MLKKLTSSKKFSKKKSSKKTHSDSNLLKQRFAAIDVGSNAIRLMIGQMNKERQVQILKSEREPLRLGQDAFTGHLILPETTKKLRKVFHKFQILLKKEKVTRVCSVATSALRDVTNRNKIINEIEETSGLHLCVITGIQEAELINGAVGQVLNVGSQVAAFLDIGGGSLEMSLFDRGNLRAVQTFPMGTVRLLEEVKKQGAHLELQNPKSRSSFTHQSEYETLKSIIQIRQKEIGRWFRNSKLHKKVEIVAGTGGNVETLGKLRMSLLGRTSSHFLLLEDIETLIRVLSSLTPEARIQKLGLRPDRADVILPAAMTLHAAMNILGTNDLLIPRVGLKDGLMLYMRDRFLAGDTVSPCFCGARNTSHYQLSSS